MKSERSLGVNVDGSLLPQIELRESHSVDLFELRPDEVVLRPPIVYLAGHRVHLYRQHVGDGVKHGEFDGVRAHKRDKLCPVEHRSRVQRSLLI